MKKRHRESVLLGFLSMLLAFYWCWTYTGPFRWLAEWQLKSLEVYYPSYTFMICCGLFYLPLNQIYQRLLRRPDDEVAESGGSSWANLPWTWIVIACFMLVTGGYGIFVCGEEEQPTLVSAVELEAGQVPRAHWLEVKGNVLVDDAIAWEDRGAAVYFVPIVSEEWQPGQPIGAYLKANEEAIRKIAQQKRIRGLSAWFQLPGPIRVAFEKKDRAPAEGYLMVDANLDPKSSSLLGAGALLAACVCMVVGCGIWFYQAPRIRTPSAGVPEADYAAGLSDWSQFGYESKPPGHHGPR